MSKSKGKEETRKVLAQGLFSDFTIIIPFLVREKIQHWVDKADKEVSGLGDAWIDYDKKVVTITNAFMLKQECTASDTELDDKAVAEAMFQAHQDEQAGIKRNIKFWWHSHVDMGVFWSATDVQAMHELSEQSWFVNVVFNKKRHMLGAISYPFRTEAAGMEMTGVSYDSEIPVLVAGSVFSQEQLAEMDKEFDDNYEEKQAPIIYTGGVSNLSVIGHQFIADIRIPIYQSPPHYTPETSFIYIPVEDKDKVDSKKFSIQYIEEGEPYMGVIILHADSECLIGVSRDRKRDILFRNYYDEKWYKYVSCPEGLEPANYYMMTAPLLEHLYESLLEVGSPLNDTVLDEIADTYQNLFSTCIEQVIQGFPVTPLEEDDFENHVFN